MATLERYNSFEELKNSDPVKPKKKKNSKVNIGQKTFKKFGELLREGMGHPVEKKK